MSLNDIKFKHPFNMIVSGMTQSGKTEFVRRLLKNWQTHININKSKIKILWCFKGKYPESRVWPNIEIIFYKNLPNHADLIRYKPDIIVLDDLMNDVNQETSELFTIHSHSLGISVIFIVQNLFNKNKFMRNISTNCHYIIMMRGLRNANQVESIAKQTVPGKTKQIVKIFKQATIKPFTYLIFDFHPNSNPDYLLRTRIFKEELTTDQALKHSFAPVIFDLN